MSTDWVAAAPQGWRVAPLGFHFRERKETVSDSDYAALSVTKAGVVPQLSTAAKTDNNDNRKLVVAGDFAINSRSDRKGSAGVSQLTGSVSVVYTVLEPRATIHGPFAHHLLRSEPFQEEFYRWGNGIVDDLWSTRYSAMKRIPLAVPALAVQRAIADYLDRETAQIDTLISEQQRLIDLLRERKVATVEAAFAGGSGDRVPLKLLAAIQTGVTLSGEGDLEDDEWPYLRVANVQVGHVDTETIKTVRVSSEKAAQSTLQPGDVLMTEGGDLDKLGRGALWDGAIAPMLHQNHIFAVRPGERLLPEFLVAWLDASPARVYFRNTAKKTTNIAATNKWTLGNLPVWCPPVAVQRDLIDSLTSRTRTIDSLITEAERFIELARERRSALITEAVTGQLDIPEAS